ncbi:MAG TPA: shikimate kinase [Acidimicrobiales bacterium]|nr:shikimate kinase [Acidimicrobiales bacterium]
MGHIVLVGMMGAGKTTIGRALARNRGWAFIDSDAQVEARAGRTVAEIWAAEGEQEFRTLESAVLLEALAADAPAVIAAAGGTVLDRNNSDLLRSHRPVVWLRADSGTLVQRLGEGLGRPLLVTEPAAALRRLAAEREPLYAQVADVTIDVDLMEPERVVELIEEALGIDGAPNS